MFPRKATDYGHSGRQGHVPDAQSYQAIADIRGEFPFAAACLRGWADRCRWHVGLLLVAPQLERSSVGPR